MLDQLILVGGADSKVNTTSIILYYVMSSALASVTASFSQLYYWMRSGEMVLRPVYQLVVCFENGTCSNTPHKAITFIVPLHAIQCTYHYRLHNTNANTSTCMVGMKWQRFLQSSRQSTVLVLLFYYKQPSWGKCLGV